MFNIASIPLSLYIHFPWCIKKCPYCDFNSHALNGLLPEQQYIDVLLKNLEKQLCWIEGRSIISIFMGGGTPSLFSPETLDKLLRGISSKLKLANALEITLEANPGTFEQERFKEYRAIGINRLSLGIQSFNKKHLQILGRIHNDKEALNAIDGAKTAGFNNFNIDLMFGLPKQSLVEGLADLKQAISFEPAHISWYELTIEPNTSFWHKPPELPQDEDIAYLQESGQRTLADYGYEQYEVSAYAKQRCTHNLNYWEFGDYLAIGAGSHGKITHRHEIQRFHHYRHPKQYMDLEQGFIQAKEKIAACQLPFEFMLNALRLTHGVENALFCQRTGLALDTISPQLNHAYQAGWLNPFTQRICATPLGYRFLNDVLASFVQGNI